MPSLVSTVLNDREGTELLFLRMADQTRTPEEIVVVDGGSKDGTWELLLEELQMPRPWRLVVLQEEGCNVARGRNLAVAAASENIIVSTDIGCDWEPEYFEELLVPFQSRPDLEAVMGSWQVQWKDQTTLWAQADPLLRNGLKFYATPQSHATNRAIAYTKEFFLKLGGLPEDLTLAADDASFAYIIQAQGKHIEAAPTPRCVWFRPQTFQALTKEAYRNSKGAGEAGIWLSNFVRNLARFLVEGISCAGLMLIPLFKGPVILILLFFSSFILMALWRMHNWLPHWLAIRNMGGAATLGHVALLDYVTRLLSVKGYWQGLRWGSRHCLQCRARLRASGRGWW